MEHIAASISEHGLYRNIVVARDNTILAGHGVTQASKKLNLETVPVIRLDIDPNSPQALKILAGDNEVRGLAEIDDRALSEILKEIKDFDANGLLGTGYDERMLANLVMVTRPANEIADFDAAAAWVGLPEYEEGEKRKKLAISFVNDADRERFAEEFKLRIDKKESATWTTRWPFTEREDTVSIKFESETPSETPDEVEA